MNRLQHNRCYLAGAMEKDATNGRGWRQNVKTALADLNLCWLDPTDKPTNIGHETLATKRELHIARESRDYDAVQQRMKPIRCVDLRMTDISDFLIVNLDTAVPTYGTIEEIVNANRQKKPILVHIQGGKRLTPFWLLAMLPHQLIFSTWEDLYTYVHHIAYDDEIDRLNRWYFFNLEPAQ